MMQGSEVVHFSFSTELVGANPRHRYLIRSALIWWLMLGGIFPCLAAPDLQVTITVSPSSVCVGELLTYRAAVTNVGNSPANAVVLGSMLSSNASVFSVAVSQGTFTQDVAAAGCQLGSLGAGQGAVLTVVVTPQSVGTITNTSGVSSQNADANPADNAATETTLVVPLTFYPGANMVQARHQHTATLLLDGKVLIAGGEGATGTLATAELYDPSLKTFQLTGNMPKAMQLHSATLLQDGTVLLAGGVRNSSAAMIYHPTNGSFTAVSNLLTPRTIHTATLLPDGRVLFVGDENDYRSAELYVPALHGFVATGSRSSGAWRHQALRLPNNTVAMIGGTQPNGQPATNELYLIASGTFVSLGASDSSQTVRCAAELLDGTFLLPGGWTAGAPWRAATIFGPAATNFTATGELNYQHYRTTATRVPDGKVLVVGTDYGYVVSDVAHHTPELYDPSSGTFSRTAILAQGRQDHTATRLTDGTVLVTGGYYWYVYGPAAILASTEIYDPARTKPPPAISLGNVTVLEGDTGTTNALLPLTLSSPMGLPVSVNFWGMESNALVTFPPGVTNITVPIVIQGDRNFAPDQVLGYAINSAVNAVVLGDYGLVTVLNDDPMPTASVAPVASSEGNVGANSVTLTVFLSAASTDSISVDFVTGNGTALGGTDFYATNGTVMFDPGVTNQSVQVRLRPDIVIEPDEVFYLDLFNATNALIATNQFPATILNDDGLPGNAHHFDLSPVSSPQHERTPFPLTIVARDAAGQIATNFNGGVTVWATLTNAPWLAFDFEEGDFSQWTPLHLGNTPGPYEMSPFDVAGRGVATLAFRVLANAGAADGITRAIPLLGGVTYFLSVDLAAWHEDGGFGNGDPSTAHVLINNQEIGAFNFGIYGIIQPNQAFRTNLVAPYTAPSNGTYELSLRFDRGYGQASVWSYADNVRLSAARLTPVWLSPFTNGVWSGSFQINANALGLSLLAEDPEGHRGEGNSFNVETTAGLALQVTSSTTTPRAGADVAFTLTATNRGPSTASGVVISNALVGDWTFRSATVSQGVLITNGNTVVANVGIMTNGRSVTLTIIARPHTIDLLTNAAAVGSAVFDGDLANNAVLTVVTATPPLLRVNNLSFTEGDAGTNFAQVAVWQDGLVAQTLSLDYTTANGSALAGVDFVASTGTLVIPPNVVTQLLSLPVLGDVVDEPNRTFTLQLANPTNATLNSSSATVTIVDNDPLPAVSIADAAVLEGNSGVTNLVFQVTLANPSWTTVQITCATTNGTALSGSDFGSTTASVTFPSGNTNQTFTVPVFGDFNNEVNQTFLVNLSGPVNCSIGQSPATGTIVNDDATPGSLLRFGFDPIPSPQYVGRGFPITVRAVDYLGQPVPFGSSVTLKAQTDQYYIRRLADDFEDGDLAGWANLAGGSMVAANANDAAAFGSRSLRLTGKAAAGTYFNSLRYTITNSRPNRISFFVRSAQTNAITGRIWAYGGAGYRAFDFYLNKDGRMGLFNNTTALVTVPYTSNQWYQVDLELTWGSFSSSRKVKCLIDGVVLTNNLNFLDDTYSGLDWISVQNTEIGTSWFDQVHVYDSFPSNLVVTPTTLGGFSSGVWTGNVTVTPATSNAYFTVADTADHAGQSGLFDLLPLSAIPRPQLKFPSTVPLTSAGLDLKLEGLSGVAYRVEASTNLANWLTLTNLFSPDPVIYFRDTTATNGLKRFYRAVSP